MASGRLESGAIPAPGKRGRGRPPGTGKGPNGKPTAASKKHDAEQTKFMVSTLLTVAFNVSAIRLGDHWKLSAAEAEALAEPITAIMDRHDLTEKTGAYGEYIALIAAIGMIIVPKVMIHMEMNKKPKEGGMKLVQGTAKPIAPTSGGNPTPIRAARADDGSREPVHGRDPNYRASDVKRDLAWLG